MINASVVIFKHRWEDTHKLFESLLASPLIRKIYVVDNSPKSSGEFDKEGLTYIFTGTNKGYGAGHNIAIRRSMEDKVPYHVVINPDIELDPQAFDKLYHFAEAHPEAGHLMPEVLYPDGALQYLCKLLPAPADLFMRRFLPEKLSRRKMYRFEMRASGYDKIMYVPYLSGCFMFLRTEALEKAGLFDERFFMYPEDIDLTRRIGKYYETLYYPEVNVIHLHEKSSYKNIKMLFIHVWNLILYFNKWGWFYDKERKQMNDKAQKQYKS